MWLWAGLVVLCGSLIAAVDTSSSGAATDGHHTPQASAFKPGMWTALGPALKTPEGGTPAVWMGKDHRAWVVWLRQVSANVEDYEVARLGANGGVSDPPAAVFTSPSWQSLSDEPTLLAQGSEPVVVFDGIRGSSGPYSDGCIYGAVPGKSQWSVQPWSLSGNCTNPIGSAGEGKGGALSAAWPGGWTNGHGVLYRVGVSPTIPATAPDSQIALAGSADAYKTGDTGDLAGNGDFYVAWAREFSNGQDGYYVENVTAHGAAKKAPGSNTNSVNDLGEFADLAIANTSVHAGVFVAYCVGSSECHLLLWRVGAGRALSVPGSSDANDVAISAGPSGRLWIAWANNSTNDVSVVRTNIADTRFGAVETYSTPCFEHELLGLSGGGWGRLDIAMQCVNNAKLQLEEFATQSLVGLALSPGDAAVHNKAASTVTFSVTDVGDPVAGATVTVDGKHVKTNAAGRATVSFPKGTKAGTYGVTASAFNYLAAHGNVSVSK